MYFTIPFSNVGLPDFLISSSRMSVAFRPFVSITERRLSYSFITEQIRRLRLVLSARPMTAFDLLSHSVGRRSISSGIKADWPIDATMIFKGNFLLLLTERVSSTKDIFAIIHLQVYLQVFCPGMSRNVPICR